MKAVITGATGFIGSHLTRAMIGAGWEVHALKRASSSLKKLINVTESVVFHNLDNDEYANLWDTIGPTDVFFHLATNYGRNKEGDDEVFSTNYLLPCRLITASPCQIPLCVTTDTCFPAGYPYLRSYTQSKREFANWGKNWANKNHDRFVNVVLQHPYGPNDSDDKFVPWVMQQCLDNVKSIELTNGTQKKDFVFVTDVVKALMIVATRASSFEEPFVKLPCGSGKARSIRSFVEQIHVEAQSTSHLNFGAIPNRNGEPSASYADITRLDELGWKPETDIKEGIRSTLDWYRAQTTTC